MFTLLICFLRHTEFKRRIKELTRVITTLHIIFHQNNVFSDLDLLLSEFAIIFKKNNGLPENRNKTPNLKSVEPNQGLDYLYTT